MRQQRMVNVTRMMDDVNGRQTDSECEVDQIIDRPKFKFMHEGT